MTSDQTNRDKSPTPEDRRRIRMPSHFGNGLLDFENPIEDVLTVHGLFDLDRPLTVDFTKEMNIFTPLNSNLEIAVVLGGEVGMPWANASEEGSILKAGQVGIWRHREYEVHRIDHKEGRKIEYFGIVIGDRIFDDFFQNYERGLLAEIFAESTRGQNRVQFLNNSLARLVVPIRQYLATPFVGGLRRVYKAGKAKEIISLIMGELFLQKSEKLNVVFLKERDVEKIRAAEQVLLARMDNPPSLQEIARIVGTNEQKLKVGFKHVFGNTVFGYLKLIRFEQARVLLELGGMSVSEVALAVGYTHMGHFATGFKKIFGILPSQLSKGNLFSLPPAS